MKNLSKLATQAGLQNFKTELPDYWVAEMQKQFGVDPRGGKLNGEVVWIVWSFDQYVALGDPYPLSAGAKKLLALWEAQKAVNAAAYQRDLASGKHLAGNRLEYEEFEEKARRFEKLPYAFERKRQSFEKEPRKEGDQE
jgi:hypothetical protein